MPLPINKISLISFGLLASFISYKIYKEYIILTQKAKIIFESVTINKTKTLESLFENIYLDVKIKINNPDNFKIRIHYVRINILINNTQVAMIDFNTPFYINSKASIENIIPVSIPIKNFPEAVRDSFKKFKTNGITLKLTGSFKTDLGTYTFEKKI